MPSARSPFSTSATAGRGSPRRVPRPRRSSLRRSRRRRRCPPAARSAGRRGRAGSPPKPATADRSLRAARRLRGRDPRPVVARAPVDLGYGDPMDFELSEELAALRDSVRRLVERQDQAPCEGGGRDRGVPPRTSSTRSVTPGCSACASRTAYGGSGAGIFGLALAIEEVTKYSNVAGLMLLLTRLPDGAGDDRGDRGAEAALFARHRRGDDPLRASGSPSPRRAATSPACGREPSRIPTPRAAGSSTARSAGCPASRRPTGTRCSPRPATRRRGSTTSITAFLVDRDRARPLHPARRQEDGRPWRRHRRAAS